MILSSLILFSFSCFELSALSVQLFLASLPNGFLFWGARFTFIFLSAGKKNYFRIFYAIENKNNNTRPNKASRLTQSA
jgi:hypothetical protein